MGDIDPEAAEGPMKPRELSHTDLQKVISFGSEITIALIEEVVEGVIDIDALSLDDMPPKARNLFFRRIAEKAAEKAGKIKRRSS